MELIPAHDLIKKLELLPHPEGGYYRELYRSEESIPRIGLPDRYHGNRSFSTAIYFMLTANDISKFHHN